MDERHGLDRRERGTRLEARYLPAYKTERFNPPQSAELPRERANFQAQYLLPNQYVLRVNSTRSLTEEG